jgi:hypothetical protein
VDVSDGAFRALAHVHGDGLRRVEPDALLRLLDRPYPDVASLEQALATEWNATATNWGELLNGGVYSAVDRDNVVYANYGSNGLTLFAFGLIDPADPSAGIQVLRHIDLTDVLTVTSTGVFGASLVGVNMTYDGRLVALGRQSVAVLDRDFGDEPQIVRFGEDEYVTNATAIDDRGGIYVASDKIMRKLVWTGVRLSDDEADGAWACPYDTGRQPPSVKFGTGTGSTPTLLGFADHDDKLVVITDGADHMHLVAFWRDDIPKDIAPSQPDRPRIADQIAVTCGLSPLPEFIQSEQSVVVSGRGAFVVNNVRDEGSTNALLDVIAGGPLYASPHGAERFEWDPTTHRWASTWTRNDVVSTSMVPTMSETAGMVFVNGYTEQDGWEVTGMDWDTGETVHRTIFGHDQRGNGAYALIEALPNGDLLFNSIAGPMRVSFDS